MAWPIDPLIWNIVSLSHRAKSKRESAVKQEDGNLPESYEAIIRIKVCAYSRGVRKDCSLVDNG